MKGGDAKKTSFLGSLKGKPYLCNVFFIVLDLRLTRLGYSGIPFFFAPLLLEGDKISVFMKFHTSFSNFSVWFRTLSVFAPFHPTTHSHFLSLPSIIL